jgi:hypothetical protein
MNMYLYMYVRIALMGLSNNFKSLTVMNTLRYLRVDYFLHLRMEMTKSERVGGVHGFVMNLWSKIRRRILQRNNVKRISFNVPNDTTKAEFFYRPI